MAPEWQKHYSKQKPAGKPSPAQGFLMMNQRNACCFSLNK